MAKMRGAQPTLRSQPSKARLAPQWEFLSVLGAESWLLAPGNLCLETAFGCGGTSHRAKKQGATGITTVAPYIAGQWGRGEDRLLG
jgi:hypothetical protein